MCETEMKIRVTDGLLNDLKNQIDGKASLAEVVFFIVCFKAMHFLFAASTTFDEIIVKYGCLTLEKHD